MISTDKKFEEIPETYKRYVVRRIINPGVYWMSKHFDDAHHKREMEQFDYLLRKNVEKIANIEKISIGKIIAVKQEAGFHRGLVTDIFNRKTKIIYLILLIDHGDLIEANQKKIYWIKNIDLIKDKASGIKVSIKDIQPIALDIKSDKHLFNGLFQRRVQYNWSVCAYKYVEDLFEKNPCVFVKPLLTTDGSIFGEIYFMEELDEAPVSLGQKLCDKGFAIFSEVNSRVTIEADLQGDQDFNIEQKIPKGALSTDLQPEEILSSDNHLLKNGDGSRTHLHNTNIDLPEQSNRYGDSEEENISLLENKIENKRSCLDLSPILNSNTYSPYWVLKARLANSSSSSSCDSVQKQAKSEKISTTLTLEYTRGSIFKVVKRSLELYEKQKKEFRGHCHN